MQRDVVIDDGRASGRGHVTVLSLAWQRADPLAVTLHLVGQPDHPSLPRGEWAVLRDFLRYGLEEATGDGSVRIRPTGDGRVVLELHKLESHGEKPYQVKVAAEVLRDFLDETELVVPTGEEASEQVLDALIERLLES